MKNLDQQALHKILIWPVIVCLLAVIGLVIIKPKIKAINLLRQQQTKNKQFLAQLTEKVLTLEGLDQVELETKTEKVLAALPASKNIPNLLTTLKVLGQQTGVTVKQIEVSPGALSTRSAEAKGKKSDLPFLAFGFTTESESEKLRDFLDKIRTTLPLMSVQSLSLKTTEEGLIEGDVNLGSFYLLLPTQLGEIESPLPLLTDQEEKAYQALSDFKTVETSGELPSVPSGKDNPFTF